MLKKVLTIAMIGTSLVSFAKVNMFFRDAVLAMPDAGGHFMSWHTEGSDETLYKSLWSGTTVEEMVKYMAEDAEKVNEQLDLANGPFAGQCTENGWWPATEQDWTSGPRYFRTCKPNVTGYAAKEDRPNVPVPVSGGAANWGEAGVTKDAHKILAWEYISDTPHSGPGTIYYQEFAGLFNQPSIDYSVSDNWQTVYCMVDLPQEWIDGSTYLWMVHNEWQNKQEQVTIRVKGLRLLTLAEAEAEAAGAKGDSGMTLSAANGCVMGDTDDEGNRVWALVDGDPNGYNPVFFGSGMVANVPVDNTIFAFDYKASEAVNSITFYVDKGSKGVPAVIAQAADGLEASEDDIFDPETAYKSYQFDLAEGLAAHEFARTFGSNDRLWVGMKDSNPDTYLYIKNVRLTNGKGGNTSAIDEVAADAAVKATGLVGAIAVEANGAFTVYNLAGVAVAAGEGVQTVAVEAGLYVVVADKAAQKVVVK